MGPHWRHGLASRRGLRLAEGASGTQTLGSLGRANHLRDFVKQAQPFFLQIFRPHVRCGLNLCFDAMNFAVHIMIAIGQRCEMCVPDLQIVQNIVRVGEFVAQVMGGVAHLCPPFDKASVIEQNSKMAAKAAAAASAPRTGACIK